MEVQGAGAGGGGTAAMVVDGAKAAGVSGGSALGVGGNPINNGLYAAEMQRQSRDAAHHQQEQTNPCVGH